LFQATKLGAGQIQDLGELEQEVERKGEMVQTLTDRFAKVFKVGSLLQPNPLFGTLVA
jgi:hypothetical protein